MKKYPHGLTLNAVCAAIDDYQRHEDSVPEEGILAAFNTLLGHSDIADALRSMERTADAHMAAAQAMRDDMYHWKQRAEAAEAKLAELAKQKPIGAFHIRDQDVEATSDYVDPGQWPVDNGVIEVFTRAGPATDLAELVPDELTWSYHDNITQGEVNSWNACCGAILRNIEEAKK